MVEKSELKEEDRDWKLEEKRKEEKGEKDGEDEN